MAMLNDQRVKEKKHITQKNLIDIACLIQLSHHLLTQSFFFAHERPFLRLVWWSKELRTRRDAEFAQGLWENDQSGSVPSQLMGISTFTSKEFCFFCRVSKIGNVSKSISLWLFNIAMV